MRISKLKTTGLALVLGLCIAAPAQAMTVRELQIACVGTSDRMKTVCEQYILGVTDGIMMEADLVGDKTHACVPGGINVEKLVLMIRAAMSADAKLHPQDANMSAPVFIGAVLTQAYPCQP